MEQDGQDNLLCVRRYVGMEQVQRRSLLPFRNPDTPVSFRQGAAHGGHGHLSLRNRQHKDRVGMDDFRPGIPLPRHAQDHGPHGQAGEFQGQAAGADRPVLFDGAGRNEEKREQDPEESVRRHKTGIKRGRSAR